MRDTVIPDPVARRETNRWMREEIEHNRQLDDRVSPGKWSRTFQI